MMIFVTSRKPGQRRRGCCASVAVSTALVESSKIKTLGLFNSVRAMHSRCFCPPETLTPPWPRSVSKPSGHAGEEFICAGGAAGLPQLVIAGRRVAPLTGFHAPCRRTARSFAAQCPQRRRRAARSYSRTSRPPTRTCPAVASYRRGISCTSVDLGRAGAAQNAHRLPGRDVQAQYPKGHIPARLRPVFERDAVRSLCCRLQSPCSGLRR